jgi:ABC-type transporter MlaC component
MSTELRDVLNVCRQIRGNDRDSGTHYLLGYLWATLSEKQRKQIATTFQNDLNEQEKNK